MADLKLCSIPDCGKPRYCRLLCRSHYNRLRKHGDPTAGRTGRGEAQRYFAEVVLLYDRDDCLIWPYTRHKKGYGRLCDGTGTRANVSRLVCQRMHGPAPSSGHVAAHSCGNGHLGCVSPKHLSWDTPLGNAADAIRHGVQPRREGHGMAKLRAEDVAEIRSLRGVLSQEKIARKFGIRQTQVSRIQLGQSWA